MDRYVELLRDFHNCQHAKCIISRSLNHAGGFMYCRKVKLEVNNELMTGIITNVIGTIKGKEEPGT